MVSVIHPTIPLAQAKGLVTLDIKMPGAQANGFLTLDVHWTLSRRQAPRASRCQVSRAWAVI